SAGPRRSWPLGGGSGGRGSAHDAGGAATNNAQKGARKKRGDKTGAPRGEGPPNPPAPGGATNRGHRRYTALPGPHPPPPPRLPGAFTAVVASVFCLPLIWVSLLSP